MYNQSNRQNLLLFIPYFMSVLIICVDDIIVIGNNLEEMWRLKEMLEKKFEIKT